MFINWGYGQDGSPNGDPDKYRSHVACGLDLSGHHGGLGKIEIQMFCIHGDLFL